MRRAWPAILAASVLAACTAIIPATREDAYEFRYYDNLSFRWPHESMPLKIWVDPAGPLYADVQIAINRWQNGLLYGEFRGVIVSDSTTADIIFHSVQPISEDGIRELNAFASQCTGLTAPIIDQELRQIHVPIPIYVYANGNQTPASLETCYRLTTTHELGHALGITNHSTNPADIMYTNPVVDALSAADKQTIELVFHSLPNLTIVRDN